MGGLRLANAAGSQCRSATGRLSRSRPGYPSGLTATAIFDVPMTGARFRRYVDESLILALKPANTVFLDNLPAHKGSGIRERIEAAGARMLYLLAYSPDSNSFELAFARLKIILRAGASRTISNL